MCVIQSSLAASNRNWLHLSYATKRNSLTGLKREDEISRFSSVQSFSCVQLFAIRGLQHARFPCPSPNPGACSNSCPLSQWCHPTISSSAISFSSCLQSFLESGSFPRSHFFASGGQSIGASATALPINIQDWFPLGWTGRISLQSKGLSGVFSNTTVQKHQCFGTQLSLFFTSIHDYWKT